MFFCFMQVEIIDEDDEVVFDDFNNDIYIQKYGVWNQGLGQFCVLRVDLGIFF